LLKKYGPEIKPAVARTPPDPWDYLPRYSWGAPRRPLEPIEETLRRAGRDGQVRQTLETRFVEVLKDAAATPAAKDYVCRRLALIGSAASVPALVALLPDEQLSNLACCALERIPDSAADEALRLALAKVPNDLRIGVIRALGNRRSQPAVSDLARWLAI